MPVAAAAAEARADDEPRTRGGVVFREEEEWAVAEAKAGFDRRRKELERSSLGRGVDGPEAR